MAEVDGGRWYAVIDGAQDPRLMALVQSCAQHDCLISGKLDPALAPALPWIAVLDPAEQLTQVWRDHGQGRHWGITLQSAMDLLHVKLQLKKFLNARLPDGRLVLFRFYDPRVLRTYLTAATPPERDPWFGGITRYSVEAAEPGVYHDFTVQHGQLLDRGQPVNGLAA
ncbi:DUF4123 domain-containing protein [Novosphingobium sp.]|uniref:DUF4123 domain-containing protein n=1 Tax=Novosphingobium sp. TaxID=1874826 RepID=UPI0027343DCB|nr:DUF4123 domain-containing protein [Novosphingobium sp.]MDP3908197.1 DUF4123 domain-containing protein [Novosphingobium sp.]